MLKIISKLFYFILLIGCSSPDGSFIAAKSIVNTKDTSLLLPKLDDRFVKHDLEKFGIKCSILAPENAYIYSSYVSDDEGERQLIVIQMSDTSNKKLEIVSSTKNLNDVTEKIQSPANLYYHTKVEYSDSCTIFYKSERKNAVEDFNKIAYNFLLTARSENQIFHLKTDSEQDFTSSKYAYSKDEVLTLLAMARSFTSKY